MNPILVGAIVAEQLEGKQANVNKDWASIHYEDIRILNPRVLIVSDEKYIKFFVKNQYLNGLRAFIINEEKSEIDTSVSTTTVTIYGEYEDLLSYIRNFKKHMSFIEGYRTQDVI